MISRFLGGDFCAAAAAVAALLVAAGCGSTVDANGEYTLSLTNRENGCNFDNWTEGDTSTGVAMTITQDTNDDAEGDVMGIAGGALALILGSNLFVGSVDGDDIDMTIFGTNSANEGNCTYTANAVMRASLDGDVLTGNIRYELATNGNPDCSEIEGCSSRQEFNGTRPPSP